MRALADSNNDLRVLLFVEADDLRGLRWEGLCAPLNNQWSLLARNAQALYSLYLPSVTDSRFPAIGRRDLRALVVAASRALWPKPFGSPQCPGQYQRVTGRDPF
jgi:hypothetical protein